MRLAAAVLTTFALLAPKPADAHDGCHARKCKARVAHRQCDQKHPRACVLHVIYHRKVTGWKRAWLLRIPGCESGWNPYARNPSGSSGLYQFLPSTWATTPYARRSIWSAFWQPYAALYMIESGRSAEWVCR